jgi:hypothetical protein
MNGKGPLVLLLTACSITSGCRGSAAADEPSTADGRDVAQRFAEAIFDGEGDAAVALLVDPDEEPLSSFAARAAAPWKARHGVVRLREMRSARRWIFRFAGTRAHGDGRFEKVRGDILVVVAGSSRGIGVTFFSLRTHDVRFSTHHDALLLPSNR